jgi:hypothetical protein
MCVPQRTNEKAYVTIEERRALYDSMKSSKRKRGRRKEIERTTTFRRAIASLQQARRSVNETSTRRGLLRCVGVVAGWEKVVFEGGLIEDEDVLTDAAPPFDVLEEGDIAQEGCCSTRDAHRASVVSANVDFVERFLEFRRVNLINSVPCCESRVGKRCWREERTLLTLLGTLADGRDAHADGSDTSDELIRGTVLVTVWAEGHGLLVVLHGRKRSKRVKRRRESLIKQRGGGSTCDS